MWTTRLLYVRGDDPTEVVGTITAVFQNGRIKFQPDDASRGWLSLPRRYQPPRPGCYSLMPHKAKRPRRTK